MHRRPLRRRVADGVRARAGLIAALALGAVPVRAQAPLPPIRVVTTQWLAQHLTDPGVVVVEVQMEGMGAMGRPGHVPGTRTLAYKDIAVER
ncbi:MAG: hypothetical protein HY275_19200, partial [Gemmatimonadetes bacterium]|nr:hypothetical protein [Gemmatimonadota bacterium]